VSIKTYRDLLDLLDREGVTHQAEPAAKSVRIPTERNGVDGVQLIRWQDEDAVLQFVQSMPLEIAAARLAAVESAVSRLNHALAWPGLDIDHERGRLAYRLVLPLAAAGLDAATVRATFRAAVRAAAELVPTMGRIAAGTLLPEAAVDDLRSTFTKPTGAAPMIFPID